MAFKSLEEQREYMRQWRAQNPDYQKEHYARNLEKRRAEKRAAYRADPELCKERAKRYRIEHPEKYREMKARYRAKNGEKENARVRKWLEENPERAEILNAKRCLRDQTGIAMRDIPEELASAKAAQLQIDRWLREQAQVAEAEASPTHQGDDDD